MNDGINKNEIKSHYNCNMCKKAKMYIPIGNICLGEKCLGKVIKYDDAICDEFEFGGFIELMEGVLNLPKNEIRKEDIFVKMYTFEQIVDAIVQADEEIVTAINYKDRDMLENTLRDYL